MADGDQATAGKATTNDPGTTPPGAPDPEQERQQVAQVLNTELERIDSPEAAEAVVEEIETLASGATTGERAANVVQAPETAGQAVQAAAQAPGTVGTAAALTEAAAQIVAPTPESPVVAKAAAQVLPPRAPAPTPEARRGQRLLREALLRRMKPIQAVDTRIFLAVNCLSHPPATDS